MHSPPKHYQLPLKQTLVLGIIGLVILATLLKTTNSPPMPERLQVTFNQGIYMRRGPSDRFNPPIGSYAAGQTADILSKNEAGDWYEVRGANGEGWVSAEFVTTTGDLSQIPIVADPPIPINTPAPAPSPTLPSLSNANLVLGNVLLPLICGQTVEMKIDVANLGREANETYGFISVKGLLEWSGAEYNNRGFSDYRAKSNLHCHWLIPECSLR